jgi:hypothetical protein
LSWNVSLNIFIYNIIFINIFIYIITLNIFRKNISFF